jgi:thiamine-phosphate pyrophosphorylase
MRPVICMVTARETSTSAGSRALVDRIRAAAHAGVHLVQVRQPDLEGLALTRLVEDAVLAVRGTKTRVIVNDRVDVALSAGAHGVHLRGDSVRAPLVRTICPRAFMIGRSVHSPEEADRVAREGGLDYLVFGTVFSTSSKPGRPPAGPALLADTCSAVALPVLAIGGITPDRLSVVAESGAAGFAAINLFAECALNALPSVVDRAAHAFDTPMGVP